MATIRTGVELTDGMITAIAEVPQRSFTFVKQELFRHVTRFRKRMVTERMSGPPGIKGGPWARAQRRDRNLSVWTKGTRFNNLEAGAKISKALRIHEEGHTFTGNPWLYIRTGPRWKKRIVAKVRSVTIPPRLGFVTLWEQMLPDAQRRVREAIDRAVRVTRERAVARQATITIRVS